MKLTPENLINLPIGKYRITRKPYITNPDFEEVSELVVWVDNDVRRYAVGKFPERFNIEIKKDEEEDYMTFIGYAMVAGFGFTLLEYSAWELKKCDIGERL